MEINEPTWALLPPAVTFLSVAKTAPARRAYIACVSLLDYICCTREI